MRLSVLLRCKINVLTQILYDRNGQKFDKIGQNTPKMLFCPFLTSVFLQKNKDR